MFSFWGAFLYTFFVIECIVFRRYFSENGVYFSENGVRFHVSGGIKKKGEYRMDANFVRKSILAGILIGLGGYAFLAVNDRFVGAFVFSVGLISVILLKCNLYTGKVGYARSPEEVPGLLIMCLLNMVGAALMGFAARPVVSSEAKALAQAKLQKSPVEIFVLAVMCGALIYLAVEAYKKTQHLLAIIIPVFVFVASGADHCIANAFYFAAAMSFTIETAVYLVICVAGNAVGSLVISLLQVND